jgi:hypothetical protein
MQGRNPTTRTTKQFINIKSGTMIMISIPILWPEKPSLSIKTQRCFSLSKGCSKCTKVDEGPFKLIPA